MKKISIQYMAGLADSDGSFCVARRNRATTTRGYHLAPLFQITWKKTSKAINVLRIIQKQYGGNVFISQVDGKFGRCQVVKYTIERKALEPLLRDIIPYLLLKKEQAKLLLKLREGIVLGKYHKGNEKPKRIWEREDKIYHKVRELNSKNGKGKKEN